MGRTQLTGEQIKDGRLYREDLNTTTSGKAVITKAIPGPGIIIESTGVDEGTGDVTFSADTTSSDWTIVITEIDQLASSKDHIFLDGTSVLTITLPGSPIQGNIVKVTDISGNMETNPSVIDRNGSNIMKLSENFNINANYVTCIFTYLDSSRGWGIEF